MGYFNYFIKCIIRNIAYRLCKPKVLFTILLAFCVLFGMKHFGFCALSDLDYQMIADGFSVITSNQGTMISQLSSLGVDVSELETKLNTINTTLNNIKVDTNLMVSKLDSIMNDVDDLNTNILNIYNKLDSNQRELLTELEENNKQVLDELKMIREAINGTTKEPTNFTDLGIVKNNENSVYMKFLSINYEPGYSYTVKIYYSNPHPNGHDVFYYASDNIIPQDFNYYDYMSSFYPLGWVPASTSEYVFTFDVPATNPKYLAFSWGLDVYKIEVFRSIKGIVENLNQSNSLQQQQNQLQQQQNQLQQEQNDILTNDEVNTDDLQFAQDNTNNPTSEGFNTLFMTIYNAFCNSTSSPLTVTLPFINQTFTISPSLVSQGMEKMGLGLIVNLIHSFYYYSVCLFIYKDINKIIEHLKSGNLTADCGNVKTEVL